MGRWTWARAWGLVADRRRAPTPHTPAWGPPGQSHKAPESHTPAPRTFADLSAWLDALHVQVQNQRLDLQELDEELTLDMETQAQAIHRLEAQVAQLTKMRRGQFYTSPAHRIVNGRRVALDASEQAELDAMGPPAGSHRERRPTDE